MNVDVKRTTVTIKLRYFTIVDVRKFASLSHSREVRTGLESDNWGEQTKRLKKKKE